VSIPVSIVRGHPVDGSVRSILAKVSEANRIWHHYTITALGIATVPGTQPLVVL
jgi:hypothetical protein